MSAFPETSVRLLLGFYQGTAAPTWLELFKATLAVVDYLGELYLLSVPERAMLLPLSSSAALQFHDIGTMAAALQKLLDGVGSAPQGTQQALTDLTWLMPILLKLLEKLLSQGASNS